MTNIHRDIEKLSYLKPNPLPENDYLVELFYKDSSHLSISIRYVPDYDLFDEDAFQLYCQEFSDKEKPLQNVLKTLHHDFNNEVIPRFLQIEVSVGSKTRLIIEDSRPGWENLDFMKRLKKI